MAKIAVKSEQRAPESRQLASGDGWTACSVVCTSGPMDRPFEEQHSRTSIAVVVEGTFQYRSPAGRELMTPGSLLLGNAGDCFSCGHEHGVGDRCVAFHYAPEYFERIARDGGATRLHFDVPRLPPIRALAPLVARSVALLAGDPRVDGQELAIQAIAQATKIARGGPRRTNIEPSALARVTRVVRIIDNDPALPHDLRSLAHIARLSPYHFLRTFEGLTGTTPHQYLLRMRLGRAALRLRTEPSTRILDIALGCGFGDISNFNRTFRLEFGVSPRGYRAGR